MTSKTYQPLLIFPLKAQANLEQYRFVSANGNYCAAGKKSVGVVDFSTDKGQCCPIAAIGLLLVTAGGAITAGSAVTSDANGKAVAATSSDEINGYALDSVSAGEEVRILRGI